MKLGSENKTIMSKARDDLNVPQGKTVSQEPLKKIRLFEIYRQYIRAGCTRSALARQQSFEKVPSSNAHTHVTRTLVDEIQIYVVIKRIL